MSMATKSGFYGGKFVKAGQSIPDSEDDAELASMTKDELLAEAEQRNVSASASMTKAEIIEAIEQG